MTAKIQELIKKYREILVYLIVGGMTTLFSWAVYFLMSKVLDSTSPALLFLNNTVSWLAGVLFAYPFNRKWVFRSQEPKILKEFAGFAASRVSTWLIDAGIMALTVNILGWNEYLCKYCIAAVIVTVLNYIFSKLFVFRRKK